MSKEHDLVLNILANPQCTIGDFASVGLTGDNTELKSESEYLKSDKINTLDEFKDANGNFDKNKFHNFYLLAGVWYNHLANNTSEDKIKKFIQDENQKYATFDSHNFLVEDSKRNKDDYQWKMVKQSNPFEVSMGLSGINKRGEQTQTISELAQHQGVKDYKSGKTEETPEDAFWKYIDDTLVLAEYEEGEDIDWDKAYLDEETGHIYKLNDSGNFYYETLGGRSVYGKQVLNKMNVLTKEGSTLNRFDFLDSDDMKKSVGGTLMKNLALVGSMFIPYVGPVVTGLSIGTQLTGLFGTLGKFVAGSDNETLNNIEGWAKSFGRLTSSEYAGKNTWCWENLINMVGDTVGLLKEQRWIFETAGVLKNGMKGYQVMSESGQKKILSEALRKLEEATQKKSGELLALAGGDPAKIARVAEWAEGMKLLNQKKASDIINELIKSNTKIASPLSKAYMTAITVLDMYGEAKLAGASDTEAALLTLGYAVGEATILNTDIGEWILPELKGNKMKQKMLAETLTKDVRVAYNVSNPTSNEAKRSITRKIVDAGKKLSLKLRKYDKSLGTVIAHGSGEAVEEISEEVLSDLSKSLFNVSRWLRGEDALDLGAWENMSDRYLMSGIGGFLGGGISSFSTDFSAARHLAKMNNELALQELIHMVNNGEDAEFLREVSKLELGNRNLSANKIINVDGENITYELGTVSDNLDKQVKDVLKGLVDLVRNLLTTEGAKISTESLLNKLTTSEQEEINKQLRTINLAERAISLSNYTNDFIKILSDIIKAKAEIKSIEDSKPDHGDYTTELTLRLAQLNTLLNDLRVKKDSYLLGKIAPYAIRDGIVEMNPVLHKAFIGAVNEKMFAENKYHKKYNTLSDNEKAEAKTEYDAFINDDFRNQIRTASDLMFNMMQEATPFITLQIEYMKDFKNSPEMLEVLALVAAISNPALFDDSLGDTEKSLLLVDLGEQEQSLRSPAIFNTEVQTKLHNIILASKNTQLQAIQNIEQLLNADAISNGWDPSVLANKLNTATNALGEIYGAYSQFNYGTFIMDQIDTIIKLGEKHSALHPEIKLVLNGLLNNLVSIEQNLGNNADTYMFPMNGFVEDGKKLLQYSDLFRDKRSELVERLGKLNDSPIIEFLNGLIPSITSNGINISKHLNDTEERLYSASSDLSGLTLGSEWSANNDEVLKVMEIAEALLEGAKVDNASFGNPTGFTKILNGIYKQAGISDFTPLAEIDSELTNLLLADLRTIIRRLNYAKQIDKWNRGSKFKMLDKVALNTNLLLYKQIKLIVEALDNSDELKDSLNEILEDSTISQLENYTSKDVMNHDKELEVANSMRALENALHDWSLKNLYENGALQQDKVEELLTKIAAVDGFFELTSNKLDAETELLDKHAFIGWLASRIALKHEDFHAALLKAIESLSQNSEKKIAPIMTLELAVYMGVAAMTNGDALNTFVRAYRNAIIKAFKNESELKRQELLETFTGQKGSNNFATDLLDYFGLFDAVPLFENMVFIEGIPGSGKSGGVFKMIVEIAKLMDPSIMDGVIYAHTTEKNALDAITNCNLNIQTTKAFDRPALMRYIASDWVDINQAKKGGVSVLADNSYTVDKTVNNGKLISKLKINHPSNPPKVIFIDEISLYNLLEIQAIEQFAKENGVIIMTAGDFDQNTLVAQFKLDGKDITCGLHRNMFIRTPKLGVSMRTANTSLTNNILNMWYAINKLNTVDEGDINSYPEVMLSGISVTEGDLKGIYGVQQISATTISDDMKEKIQLMFSTLKENEVVTFIYTNKDTELYKYLTSTYGKKLDLKTSIEALGTEGLYYIVEYDAVPGLNKKESTLEFMRSIYTAISRAEQGVLAALPASFGCIREISMSDEKELIIESIGAEAIANYTNKIISLRLEMGYGGSNLLFTAPSTTGPQPQLPASPTPTNAVVLTSTNAIPPVTTLGTLQPSQLGSSQINKFATLLEAENYKNTVVNTVELNTQYNGPHPTIANTLAQITTSALSIFKYDPSITGSPGNEFYRVMVDYIVNGDPTTYSMPIDEFVLKFTKANSTTQYKYNKGPIKINIGGVNYDAEIIATLENNNIPSYKVAYNNLTLDLSEDQLEEAINNYGIEPEPPISIIETLPAKEQQALDDLLNLDQTLHIPTDYHRGYSKLTNELSCTRGSNGEALLSVQGAHAADRIDNAYGLSKLPKFSNGLLMYDDVKSTLTKLRNALYVKDNNSDLIKYINKLLNLLGTTTVRYAYKSTSGTPQLNKKDSTGTTRLYSRYSIDEVNEIIEGLDHPKVNSVQNLKMVCLIFNNGKPVLEVPIMVLNSPITLINSVDRNGNPIYPDLYRVFNSVYKNIRENIYPAIKACSTFGHSNLNMYNKYEHIIDLCDLWLYTSNGIFFVSDRTWNLAQHQNNGIVLSLDRGIFDLLPEYDYSANHRPVADLLSDKNYYASQVYMTPDGTIDGINTDTLPGKPFILITLDPKLAGDELGLIERYILLETDADLPKTVKRFYVSAPRTSLALWFLNEFNLMTSTKNNPKPVYNLGNDFIAFNILAALIETNTFDSIESHDYDKNEIKAAVLELIDVENRINSGNLTAEELAQAENYKLHGYNKAEINKALTFKARANLLKQDKSFGVVYGSSGKVSMKLKDYLNAYLVHAVYYLPVNSPDYTFSQDILDTIINNCQTAKTFKITDVAARVKYAKNASPISGLVRARVVDHTDNINKYSIAVGDGKYKPLTINARIDTPVFEFNDINGDIKDWVASIVYPTSPTDTYKTKIPFNKTNEDIYFFGEKLILSEKEKLLLEYSSLPLTEDLKNNLQEGTKALMLLDIAKMLQSPMRIAKVINGDLLFVYEIEDTRLQIYDHGNINVSNISEDDSMVGLTKLGNLVKLVLFEELGELSIRCSKAEDIVSNSNSLEDLIRANAENLRKDLTSYMASIEKTYKDNPTSLTNAKNKILTFCRSNPQNLFGFLGNFLSGGTVDLLLEELNIVKLNKALVGVVRGNSQFLTEKVSPTLSILVLYVLNNVLPIATASVKPNLGDYIIDTNGVLQLVTDDVLNTISDFTGYQRLIEECNPLKLKRIR